MGIKKEDESMNVNIVSRNDEELMQEVAQPSIAAVSSYAKITRSDGKKVLNKDPDVVQIDGRWFILATRSASEDINVKWSEMKDE